MLAIVVGTITLLSQFGGRWFPNHGDLSSYDRRATQMAPDRGEDVALVNHLKSLGRARRELRATPQPDLIGATDSSHQADIATMTLVIVDPHIFYAVLVALGCHSICIVLLIFINIRLRSLLKIFLVGVN
jgi:hypothetical protein